MIDEREPLRVLWTGGWDSTFRVLQLALTKARAVQPWYVVEGERRASSAERDAMRSIRDRLRAINSGAADRVRETIEVRLDEVAPDAHLFAHYEACLQYGFIGGQYEWLARLCAERRIAPMELAVHRDDKARELLVELIDATRTQLDPRFAGDPRYELFRCFRFPLFDMTKRQMRNAAREAGFEELMNLTWFCHQPRNGEPCGVCNPCIYTIEEGLGDRIPLRGRIRHALRITPRLRHALVRRPALYMRARALYRKLRGLKRRGEREQPATTPM